MIQAYIEPDRRIKCTVLVQTQPGQFIVENFGSFLIREIPIRHSPVGNRARNPMNELAHRSFSSAFVRICAVSYVAVEILWALRCLPA